MLHIGISSQVCTFLLVQICYWPLKMRRSEDAFCSQVQPSQRWTHMVDSRTRRTLCPSTPLVFTLFMSPRFVITQERLRRTPEPGLGAGDTAPVSLVGSRGQRAPPLLLAPPPSPLHLSSTHASRAFTAYLCHSPTSPSKLHPSTSLHRQDRGCGPPPRSSRLLCTLLSLSCWLIDQPCRCTNRKANRLLLFLRLFRPLNIPMTKTLPI